jgi:hypothetical protein
MCRAVKLAMCVTCCLAAVEALCQGLPGGLLNPTEWRDRPLAVVLPDPRLSGPDRLRPDASLGEQKVTIALPVEAPRPDVLANLAELLQCHWTYRADKPGEWVLKRHPEALKALRARAEARAKLEQRAREEQKLLLLQAFRQARKAVDEPPEEIFPGHVGRRGVPPGSEALIPFLDDLSHDEWNRLAAEETMDVAGAAGTGTFAAYDPILIWPFQRLTRAQQQSIRSALDGGRGIDYSTVVVSLANRGGARLTMGIFAGDWIEPPLVIPIEGPSLRKLRQEDREPLFLPDGPTFTSEMPEELAGRASQRVAVETAELDYAQACAALAEAIRAPVLADYYTLPRRMRRSGAPPTVADFFRAMEAEFNCSFAWRRGMLLVRRGDWPLLDPREIPESVLERCLERKRPGRGWTTLDPTTLGWVAARIQPGQIDCLQHFSWREDRNVQFAPEAFILRREYDLLRLLGFLEGPRQARLFRSGVGWGELYRAAPAPYVRCIRNRAPWLLNAEGVQDGVMRLVPAPAGVEITGTPEGARPLRMELLYRQGGVPIRHVQDTLVPAAAPR